MQQSTIARSVALEGIGLHGGERVSLTLSPARPDTGFVFVVRSDDADERGIEIPARPDRLGSAARATTLTAAVVSDPGNVPASTAGGRVGTVEHLLASLFAMGLDNVRIAVEGSEIPVVDGSAAPFVEWIRGAGRVVQAASRRVLSIDEPLEIREADRWIRITPARGLRIRYAIDFPHPLIGRQTFEVASLDEGVFERELAAARTFGFVHEIEALREAGLGRGGSLENTIILDEAGVLNPGGLRWCDEFVRHKIVDLLGDLALLGVSLDAHVEVEKGGHRLHHRLVRALAARFGNDVDQPAKSSSSLARVAVADGSMN